MLILSYQNRTKNTLLTQLSPFSDDGHPPVLLLRSVKRSVRDLRSDRNKEENVSQLEGPRLVAGLVTRGRELK